MTDELYNALELSLFDSLTEGEARSIISCPSRYSDEVVQIAEKLLTEVVEVTRQTNKVIEEKYGVYQNDKPANCRNFNVDSSWCISEYKLIVDAIKYMNNWLGHYELKEYKNNPRAMPMNTKIDFNGYGDTIEIRSVEGTEK